MRDRSCGYGRVWLLMGALACAGCSSGKSPTTPSSPSPTPTSSAPPTTTPAPAPAPTPTPAPTTSAVRLNDDFGGRPLFPSDNWWNQDISTRAGRSAVERLHRLHRPHARAASRLRSAAVRHSVRRRRRRRTARAGDLRGLRQRERSRLRRGCRLSDSRRRQDAAELHRGRRAGGGTDGDRHLLIVDRDRWLLYELFATRWTGQRWEAGSGAVFDLSVERPAARGLDVGRRRGPRDSSRARALRRSAARRRCVTRCASRCGEPTATSGRRRIAPAAPAARCRWARGCG